MAYDVEGGVEGVADAGGAGEGGIQECERGGETTASYFYLFYLYLYI